MAATKWSEADTCKFVELYKKCDCLWDYRLVDYKNKEKRNKSYELIKKEMNLCDLTVDLVKKKIKSIRDTYSVERNKIKKSFKSGMSPDEIYKPKLIWFKEADSFLNIKEGRSTFANLFSTLTEDNPKEDEEKSLADDATSSLKKPFQEPQQGGRDKKIKKTKQNSSSMPEHIVGALNKLDDLKNSVSNNDQFHYFALYMAQQFRELPVERALKLQDKIQRMIIDERLEHERNKKYNSLFELSNSSWEGSSSSSPFPPTPVVISDEGNNFLNAENITETEIIECENECNSSSLRGEENISSVQASLVGNDDILSIAVSNIID